MSVSQPNPDGRAAGALRPTRAIVDLDALEENARRFVALVSPTEVCAVVKADGYGHGAVAAAKASLAAGAKWLAVALVEEARELRASGIDAPILVLSESPRGAEREVVDMRATATVYSIDGIERLAAAAAESGSIVDVHIKVDTGMHRVGAKANEALGLAKSIAAKPGLRHTGTFTHFAFADAPSDPYTAGQIAVFTTVLDALRAEGFDPGIVHASNSAATLAFPNARFDMVRVGVSLYGNDPDFDLPATSYGITLEPVLRLATEVSYVKVLPAGSRLSYGLRYTLDEESVVATIPIGYADGVPRRLSAVGGEVLLQGRRVPMAGRVTMDQILLDCGPVRTESPVCVGDEVVLLGAQGTQRITPWEWAMRLETIAYEITCGIAKRVPRVWESATSER